MNGWAIGALLCWAIVSVTAFLIGSHAIAYVAVKETIIIGELCFFGFCFWKALGFDMYKNARG